MSSAGNMANPIFHSYFFPDDLSSLQPVSGSLTLLQKPFCFTGYLMVGHQPILYALYTCLIMGQCSASRLEALKSHVNIIAYVLPIDPHSSIWEPGTEVPIFAKNIYVPDALPVNLDLDALWSRPSNDGTLLHVYAWPLPGNGHNTIIVQALFPFGHHPEVYPEFDHNTLAKMSELLDSFDQGSVVPDSSVASADFSNSSVASADFPNSSVASPLVPASSVASSVAPSYRLSATRSHDGARKDGVNAQVDSNTLHHIQLRYPQWLTVLVHMRVLMRVAVCSGEYGNPFLLSQAADHKARFVADLFERSLAEVQLTRADLCCDTESFPVKSIDNDSEVTESEILTMAGKWLSSLFSDTKCLAKIAISDPRPALGFALAELCPRVLLIERCMSLLQHFLLPDSCRLPFAVNGLIWFLTKEIAKSLVFYVVFRRSVSAHVPIIMADFAPGIFRDVSHPPAEMLAYVGASCYNAILQWLTDILKAMSEKGESSAINLLLYPPVSQIYDELLQAVFLLFTQKDDPGYPAFVNRMAEFCDIILRNKFLAQHLTHLSQIEKHNRYRIAAAKPSLFPPNSITPPTTHILEVEHIENTLKSWLQKRGREILSDSLFVTVYVLFAWVDPLDLIAILQVNLRVVAMERLFQQEELTCVSFLLRGGRCYMEERMYRAQMEVTLFSKAIANLCEEFNTKCRPTPAPLPKYIALLHILRQAPYFNNTITLPVSKRAPAHHLCLRTMKEEIKTKLNDLFTVHVHYGRDKLSTLMDVRSKYVIITTYQTLSMELTILKHVEEGEDLAYLKDHGHPEHKKRRYKICLSSMFSQRGPFDTHVRQQEKGVCTSGLSHGSAWVSNNKERNILTTSHRSSQNAVYPITLRTPYSAKAALFQQQQQENTNYNVLPSSGQLSFLTHGYSTVSSVSIIISSVSSLKKSILSGARDLDASPNLSASQRAKQTTWCSHVEVNNGNLVYAYFCLDGLSKLEDRRDMVIDWQTCSDTFTFISIMHTDSHRINLTTADNISHRFGQTHHQVAVYRLVTKGTIDPKERRGKLVLQHVRKKITGKGSRNKVAG
ncbi:uncharacterized protein F5891DRAFT_983197 [Suillus fuscotomentosus]|uniref:Uncharacterized protein n=1 Tax=Suillus fuscotomentosus TaxID=1912939 RepID=A0AAD4HGH6_9AGAM|nr:uncharacterized protein F5891DRAFT_983197 [Suillus fuscotomentosus]KAG1896775.1 hypothetical protein F5891DRAFT_983197 [Suillus fuscotomentosus]